MVLNIPGEEGESIFPHNRDYSEGIRQRGIRAGQATIVVALDGSGDAETIQEGLKLIPSEGGIVFVKEGLYTIKSVIKIKSNITLQGTGFGTRLDLQTDTINCIQNDDQSSGNNNISIKGFRITVNNGFTSGTFIHFVKVDDSFISECWLESSIDGSITLNTCDRVIIESVFISASGAEGIDLGTAANNCIVNGCQIKNCASGLIITGNNNIVSNSQINASENPNVNITGGDNNTITGNQCNDSTDDSGILLDSTATRNIILGNHCVNNGTYGIREAAGADDKNIIVGNVAHSNTTAQISTQGAATVNANNVTS